MDSEHLADTRMDGFADLILPHLDAAHKLARWLLRSSDASEDVVQEACLRAFRYAGTFRGVNARAWLLSIVRTTAFRWLENNRTQSLATEFNEEIHSERCRAVNPETLLLEYADTQFLQEAISGLPDRFQHVLRLRELEGLSYKEIAQVLRVPMGTVMSTLSRARKRLQHAAINLVPSGANKSAEDRDVGRDGAGKRRRRD